MEVIMKNAFLLFVFAALTTAGYANDSAEKSESTETESVGGEIASETEASETEASN